MKESMIDHHPENLEVDKRYKVKYKGGSKQELEFVKTGRFRKISIIYTDESPGYCLGVQFQFSGEGLPTIIAWKRVVSVELTKPKRGDK